MINYLKKKWGIESSSQFVIVMVVFALTGSAAALLSKPLLTILNLNNIPQVIYWPLRLTIIFPIYQILLILFGYIFGLIMQTGCNSLVFNTSKLPDIFLVLARYVPSIIRISRMAPSSSAASAAA